MDFELVPGVGWRDLVLVAAAVIGVYLALSVIRLFKVERRRDIVASQTAMVEFDAWKPHVEAREVTPPPEPAAHAPEFAAELARSNAEVELQSLRRESAQLRAEVARLTADVARIKATGSMSPLYNEAMVLAQQGMPVSGIAGHCGISVGEAELVAALARSAPNFERHETSEDRNERNTDSGNRRGS